MLKRIIDISEPAYIRLKQKQLCIEKEKIVVGMIPIEDLGVLILQNPAIVITQAVIIACQKNNTAVIFCDEKYLPYSVILPLADAHSLHNKILKTQISLKSTRKKFLWHLIVKEKINQQAITLTTLDKNARKLLSLANRVKSGDKENHEAQAAQYYWRTLMGNNFRRDVNTDGFNAVLNYGYSIIRAMTARAIVASGLHPTLGLYHDNQYNGLCLADDLMEPFRPWVDYLTYRLWQQDREIKINQKVKEIFLGLLSMKVIFKHKTMPLMIAVSYFIAQLKTAYVDHSLKHLNYPKWART